MALSDVKIRSLKAKDCAYKVSDFDGLSLTVKPNGSKLWRLKYRLDGKEKSLSIGVYPAVSLQQARIARDEARSKIAQGLDPSEIKQEEKRIRREAKGQTFEKVGAAFLAKQRKEGKSTATLSKTEYHLKLANRDFGREPITDINATMILRTLRKVEAKGNYETAHRLPGFPEMGLTKFKKCNVLTQNGWKRSFHKQQARINCTLSSAIASVEP